MFICVTRGNDWYPQRYELKLICTCFCRLKIIPRKFWRYLYTQHYPPISSLPVSFFSEALAQQIQDGPSKIYFCCVILYGFFGKFSWTEKLLLTLYQFTLHLRLLIVRCIYWKCCEVLLLSLLIWIVWKRFSSKIK